MIPTDVSLFLVVLMMSIFADLSTLAPKILSNLSLFLIKNLKLPTALLKSNSSS